MSRLVVWMADRRVGELIRKANGNLQFRYAPDYAGPPISQALPKQPHGHGHAPVRAVFGGLLPEGDAREVLARNVGVSAGGRSPPTPRRASGCHWPVRSPRSR